MCSGAAIGMCIGVFAAIFMPSILYAAATSTIVNLNNPGFENSALHDPTKALGWQNFGDGYTRSSEAAHTGNWSIKLMNSGEAATSGAYERINLHQTTPEPVFIGGFIKGLNISLTPGSTFGASLYVEIHYTDGTIVSRNSLANQGTFDWRWIGLNTSSAIVTKTASTSYNKPIDYIFIVPALIHASGTAYFDDISVQEFVPTQSALTLMFDDGNTSDYTIAKPILDQYGLPGTSAIITSYINKFPFLSLDQIKALANDGWEIVSHTVTHPNLGMVTSDQAETEFRDSKAALESDGFDIDSIAFPFGAYSSDVLAQSENYYISARSFEDGYNPQGSFPYEIRIQKIVASTTVADVQNWVEQAQTNKQWLIIVTHLISGSGSNVYHVSPQMFESMMEAVHNSGIKVVTYNEGIKEFAVPNQNNIENVPLGDTQGAGSSIDVRNIILVASGCGAVIIGAVIIFYKKYF